MSNPPLLSPVLCSVDLVSVCATIDGAGVKTALNDAPPKLTIGAGRGCVYLFLDRVGIQITANEAGNLAELLGEWSAIGEQLETVATNPKDLTS